MARVYHETHGSRQEENGAVQGRSVAARNGCCTRRWSFAMEEGMERGVAEESRHGTQECARHGAWAWTWAWAWVRFFIFGLGRRGLAAFGRLCHPDAPVWFR